MYQYACCCPYIWLLDGGVALGMVLLHEAATSEMDVGKRKSEYLFEKEKLFRKSNRRKGQKSLLFLIKLEKAFEYLLW